MVGMNAPDTDAAERFLVSHARVLELRRFERLFRGGEASAVRDAVAAYRNSDGGFGQALEPDCRCPDSQPLALDFALRVLHEADAWDGSLVDGALRWLTEREATGGGAVFVEPFASHWTHAPWYAPQPGRAPSIISTGYLAGTLHERGTAHPWLDGATSVMWRLIEGSTGIDPIEMLAVLYFLDRVPDRDRAVAAVDMLAPRIVDGGVDGGMVTLDPQAAGYVHPPLEFAPQPDSVGRRLFEASVIESDLDRLAAGQAEDGGWTFTFLDWSPVTTYAWRGHFTIESLCILRANGRL